VYRNNFIYDILEAVMTEETKYSEEYTDFEEPQTTG
jgi:hypothetical protein